jgi:hypothetical protein
MVEITLGPTENAGPGRFTGTRARPDADMPLAFEQVTFEYHRDP